MSETQVPGAGAVTSAETHASPSIEWIREFTQRWLEAWNSHEPDRVLALMTEDIEYRDDSWPTTMHGHADVREFLEAIWRATPDMTFELLAGPYVIPGEPRAAFHWRGGGTHTGTTPGYWTAATGAGINLLTGSFDLGAGSVVSGASGFFGASATGVVCAATGNATAIRPI